MVGVACSSTVGASGGLIGNCTVGGAVGVTGVLLLDMSARNYSIAASSSGGASLVPWIVEASC